MIPLPEKPKTLDELKTLIDNGDIEIMLVEETDDGATRLLVCDLRRTYEEGEICEIVI